MLFKERKYTDINFKIGEDIVPAHKCLLAARCSFFDKLFSSKNLMYEKENLMISKAE